MKALRKRVSNKQLAIGTTVLLGCTIALTACGVAQTGNNAANPSENTAKVKQVAYKSNPTGPTNSQELPLPMKTADDWKTEFPQIYESYKKNSVIDNNYPGAYPSRDYTEMYPDIKYLFKGYGYSKDYTVPEGHTESLKTIQNTLRPHPKAACFACKTPQYSILEKKYGDAFYKMDFNEVAKEITEPISCYDCHENQPGEMHMNRSGLVKAMEQYDIKIDPRMQACAQCHNDYYMDPKTGAVEHPYRYGANPDGMLKHYNDEHVVDFVHPDSGAEMAQVQHPDWEAFVSSKHGQMGLVCSDCHMAKEEEGYVNHQWTSPFKSDTIMNNVCLKCHTDQTKDELMNAVNTLQADIDGIQKQVSQRLVKFHQDIAAQKDTMNADDLAKVRDLARSAQFYWGYFFAQNGDGFHNPEESYQVLDKANKLIDEGNQILEKNKA